MKKWFKRKPKVVTLQWGDYIEIYVKNGGIKHRLRLTEITSSFPGGTTALFTGSTGEFNPVPFRWAPLIKKWENEWKEKNSRIPKKEE